MDQEIAPPAVFQDVHFVSPTQRHDRTGPLSQRSPDRCATCAQSAIQIAPGLHRYGFVTVAFSRAGNNSLACDVNCAAASQVIALRAFQKRTKCIHERSQNGCATCAPPAIRLVRKSDHYRLMTVAFSCTDHRTCCGDLADALAAPEVFRKCASCALGTGAPARMVLLPKLRLGEMHVPVVVLPGREENTSGCGQDRVCTPLVVATNDVGK